jgi:hypothetical protein
MSALPDARCEALIERVSAQLIAWNLREPAIALLAMHAPLAYLGSQTLLIAQPLLGIFTGDAMARDLALLLEDPQNVERLVARLEMPSPPSHP